MTTKKASFTLANYEIASVNVTILVLIYIYVRTILFVKITNQFADSNITPSLHLGILFQIYGFFPLASQSNIYRTRKLYQKVSGKYINFYK
jgi:hypothetical protein